MLGVLIAANALFAGAEAPRDTELSSSEGVFGGPTESIYDASSHPPISIALLESSPTVIGADTNAPASSADGAFSYLDYGLLEPASAAPGTARTSGLVIYSVKKGDTLSGIAAQFGVSVTTIISSNPDMRGRSLKIGQELSIPPVSGIVYRVQGEETPESVAAAFSMSVSQLQEVNHGVDFRKFGPGTTLVIPGVHPLATLADARALSSNQLPSLSGYFIMPAEGFNWGKLHDRNAVDIANSCGTKIVAAAEGLVVDFSTDAWSSGYGHYVTLEHPNGTKTKYAHLAGVTVSIGDYVEQGAGLGTMGDTGDATGCHLHFEVEGARNPFAKS